MRKLLKHLSQVCWNLFWDLERVTGGLVFVSCEVCSLQLTASSLLFVFLCFLVLSFFFLTLFKSFRSSVSSFVSACFLIFRLCCLTLLIKSSSPWQSFSVFCWLSFSSSFCLSLFCPWNCFWIPFNSSSRFSLSPSVSSATSWFAYPPF